MTLISVDALNKRIIFVAILSVLIEALLMAKFSDVNYWYFITGGCAVLVFASCFIFALMSGIDVRNNTH